MDDFYDLVERAPGVRIRPEGENTFLLYHPGTDELHLVDARSKAIFEMCDGRSIDLVVHAGAELVCSSKNCDAEQAAMEVLGLLCSFQRRSLVRFL